jgi:hypothetical protein
VKHAFFNHTARLCRSRPGGGKNPLESIIIAKRAHNQAPRATDKRPEQIIQNIDGIIDDEAWTVQRRNYGKSARSGMAGFAPT